MDFIRQRHQDPGNRAAPKISTSNLSEEKLVKVSDACGRAESIVAVQKKLVDFAMLGSALIAPNLFAYIGSETVVRLVSSVRADWSKLSVHVSTRRCSCLERQAIAETAYVRGLGLVGSYSVVLRPAGRTISVVRDAEYFKVGLQRRRMLLLRDSREARRRARATEESLVLALEGIGISTDEEKNRKDSGSGR
ncbi:uncharacterized protein A4U43_C07F35630 [Asparagus officinalis]|uniref:Nop domain-containing protein n=1 Tax=Asparagus officinalis TaxID=4686 RepID=A0A5P1EHC3_ASPOF|nr:uncharacterized protein A4U43_C07F35630 [Asparagus officinalis]